jgi:predicted acylesterase/phospholipase RssA
MTSISNLAFKGGGVLGIAYAGAIQVLEEKGLLQQVQKVAGTSAGAMTAALVSLNYTAAEIYNIVKGTRLNVDLKLLGYDITAFVGIYLEKSSLYDTVAKELMNIPEIVRLNYITGNYSMFIEIICKDISQLRFVLHDELQKIKGIERTETFISLEEGFNRNVPVAPPD